LSSLKKLASQTLWYGLSSIAARFISYLLVPYLTYKFTESAYGEMSIVYSFIPFLNVIVTHGMETAYFRFGSKENEEKNIPYQQFLHDDGNRHCFNGTY